MWRRPSLEEWPDLLCGLPPDADRPAVVHAIEAAALEYDTKPDPRHVRHAAELRRLVGRKGFKKLATYLRQFPADSTAPEQVRRAIHGTADAVCELPTFAAVLDLLYSPTARMPRPGATMAVAILFNSSKFIASSSTYGAGDAAACPIPPPQRWFAERLTPSPPAASCLPAIQGRPRRRSRHASYDVSPKQCSARPPCRLRLQSLRASRPP